MNDLSSWGLKQGFRTIPRENLQRQETGDRLLTKDSRTSIETLFASSHQLNRSFIEFIGIKSHHSLIHSYLGNLSLAELL
jgi:hypothetical protein